MNVKAKMKPVCQPSQLLVVGGQVSHTWKLDQKYFGANMFFLSHQRHLLLLPDSWFLPEGALAIETFFFLQRRTAKASFAVFYLVNNLHSGPTLL